MNIVVVVGCNKRSALHLLIFY